MKKNFKNVLLYLGIPLILIATVATISYLNKNTAEKKYYQIVELIKENKVSEYELNNYSGQLTYVLRSDNTKYQFTVADPYVFIKDVEEEVKRINRENPGTENDIVFIPERGSQNAWLAKLLPSLLLVGCAVLLVLFMTKRMNNIMGADRSMGFGKIKSKKVDNRRKTTFADVAGADEEKEELLYRLNCGYVQQVLDENNEWQDACILGEKHPLEWFDGEVKASVTVNGKTVWLVAPEELCLTREAVLTEMAFLGDVQQLIMF